MDALKIKKGLGRGLSSLIGDTKVNTNINKLSIGEIVRNKYVDILYCIKNTNPIKRWDRNLRFVNN